MPHTHSQWNIQLYFFKKCMCAVTSFHSSMNEYLGFFHVSAIINNAIMNMRVYVYFQVNIFVSPEYISRSGISGSLW